MISWRKSKLIRILLILGVIFVAGKLIFFRNNKQPDYEFITMSRGNITQEVNVTGRVKASEQVSLAFERSGKIAAVNVKVGDRVAKNRILVTQVTSDLSAQLSQA